MPSMAGAPVRPCLPRRIRFQPAGDLGRRTSAWVKMNIDTDTQYAFTRPVADHMLRNYDGVLKVDGEVGNKKQYDPARLGQGREAGAWPSGSSRLAGTYVPQAPTPDPQRHRAGGSSPGRPPGFSCPEPPWGGKN